MKRIHWHWTGGTYKANNTDKKAYHELFEGDGTLVIGAFPINANSSARGKLVAGTYAAHTASANSDAIGLSMCCMGGTGVTERNFGKYPMTEAQFEAMMKRTALHCIAYGIPVTRQTTLSHAEIEANLGIKQKGKWDFTVLPFKPELKGARACGDYARLRVTHHMAEINRDKFVTNPSKPVSKPIEHRVAKGDTWWGISRRYSIDLNELLRINNAKSSDVLHVGRLISLVTVPTASPVMTQVTPKVAPTTTTGFWSWLISIFK